MPRTFEIIKNKTALVIVDLQNDFVRPGAPLVVNEALGTIPANKKLLTFAREKEMPVVFTKFVSGKKPTLLWNWSPEIATQSLCRRGYERYYPDINRTQPCNDIIDELKPIMPEDYIVEKYNYGAFHNTNLVDILHSEGCDTIIVTGTVTQICVFDTITGGFAANFKVVMVSDCTSTWDPLQQKAVEENTARKYGMVLNSTEIMQGLSG